MGGLCTIYIHVAPIQWPCARSQQAANDTNHPQNIYVEIQIIIHFSSGRRHFIVKSSSVIVFCKDSNSSI